MDTFANRLTYALNYRRIKQADLAEKINCSRTLITKYVQGISIPRQYTLYQIAVALEVRPDWLLGYDVPMLIASTTTTKQKIENILSKLDESELEKVLTILETVYKT